MNDMADYRMKNGNDDWSWRTISISARKVLKSGDPKVQFVQDFMREECKALFH